MSKLDPKTRTALDSPEITSPSTGSDVGLPPHRNRLGGLRDGSEENAITGSESTSPSLSLPAILNMSPDLIQSRVRQVHTVHPNTSLADLSLSPKKKKRKKKKEQKKKKRKKYKKEREVEEKCVCCVCVCVCVCVLSLIHI